ncbi:DNA translocase FtsK [Fundidesulfovibrio butyratiphilus]
MGDEQITERKKILEELIGLVLLCLACFFVLALYSFDRKSPQSNLTGIVGENCAGILSNLFGLASYFVPALLTYAGLRRLFPLLGISRRHWAGLFGLFLSTLVVLGSDWPGSGFLHIGTVNGGGLTGQALYGLGKRFFSPVGTYLLVTFLAIISFRLVSGMSFNGLAERVRNLLVKVWGRLREVLDLALEKFLVFLFGPGSSSTGEDEADTPDTPDFHQAEVHDPPAQAEPSQPAKPRPARPPKPKPQPRAAQAPGAIPPLDLLEAVPNQTLGPSQEVLQGQAKGLITCLEDFGIQGQVQHVAPGPVVTMFEVKPAPGVKISRIAGLAGDISLAMKALAVRIEAPLPGKDTVGVEIPNAKRQTVYLRDIMESDAFQKATSRLTLCVGKDIQGHPFVADLARMPHLLVAGATGSGKSVCINGILLSILYKAQPDQVRLLLIDPKRIELAAYAGLPHLAHPVVTDMALAKSALDWCVAEMDRRYELMAQVGVRNIDGYNEKVAKTGARPAPDEVVLEPMPYLVLIIDELADLMMTAGKEVEINIVRLAQLARAAGIHMVLATQRPSVDVVTGLIKANFPTRIAFQVTSKHDSRTILDTVGAEHLLGRGDMLFKPSGAKMMRMHGAFVSDEETASVVEYWKAHREPEYMIDLTSWKDDAHGQDGPPDDDFGGGGGALSDPVYPQALEFVMDQGKASISLIQRRFRIGFNRAARFIEQMEREGLLGPADGSKPRVVLRGKE